MKDVDLEIAERLHRRQPYNVIAEELKVSAKTISRVSKLVKSGAIRIDEEGKAHFARSAELGSLEEAEECMPLVYRIMRALGAENPKAALQQAHKYIVKMNPYLLYYNVKTPADLVMLLERKISELNKELNAYRNEDALSLARRLGMSEETIKSYEWLLERDEYEGTLADYLNDAVEFSTRIAKMVRERKRVVLEYRP